MMQLYNANFSPNCLRVRAVIHELQVSVEIIDVDIPTGQNRAPDFLGKNPNGKVPVLVDGNFVLWESRAITAYLATLDAERRLYPEDPRSRAVVDQWSYWQAVHLGPSSQRLTFERVLKKRFGRGEPNEEVVAAESKETMKLLGVLEEALRDKRWVAGALSIADFSLASTLTMREQAGISLDDLSNVARWIQRLEARDAWQQAIKPVLEAT
jgi:glutathione S-transferase